MTTRQAIIKCLYESHLPLAVHEFGFIGANHAAISARLREMARDGIVEGFRAEGKAYKVWRMIPRGALSGVMIDAALPIIHDERWL